MAFSLKPLLPTLLALLFTVQSVHAAHWVNAWGSMPQLTEPHNLPPAPFNQSDLVFPNSTIRQTVRATLSGEWIRIRLSNAFGGSELPITAVSIALPSNGDSGVSSIQPRTSRAVTFSGLSAVVIPSGAQVVSDPIQFTLRAQSALSVSVYSEGGQRLNLVTGHPGSRTTSWMVFGNGVDSLELEGEEKTSTNHWYWISSVETWADDGAGAVVIVGDSITDGRGSTDNGNNRWPDLLVSRLQADRATRNIAVINQAAGGNRILADGLGPNALGRIDRDVIAQPGTKYAIIFEGVNDIGTGPTTTEGQKAIEDRLIWALKQMITRLHTAGIPVFGATITPMSGPGQGYGDPTREVTRKNVNRWIRSSGAFDVVLDFDRLLADPEVPEQLREIYDTGDHLHPNVEAFKVMAEAVPLALFRRPWSVQGDGSVPPGVVDA
ncbi:lipolytic enzyme [Coprinopsis marcescibilis]|uniref:Lipolytic enzyme n=1 Tax=Coprinopsis marcescibilis TaxID=230819 RepID=A0A5C3KHJ6_COPMA|nr:lipolytic enzyme [Coprinopsis marcescibilis]